MAVEGPKSESPNPEQHPAVIDYPNLLTLYRMMSPAQQVATLNRLNTQEYHCFFQEANKPKR